jgi:queuosine precursor transporter
MTTEPQRTFRYYDLIMGAFVCVLLCSNLIGVKKAAGIELPVVGLVVFGAGNLFFPISYLFGDILTEVYGYARSRRVGGLCRTRVCGAAELRRCDAAASAGV